MFGNANATSHKSFFATLYHLLTDLLERVNPTDVCKVLQKITVKLAGALIRSRYQLERFGLKKLSWSGSCQLATCIVLLRRSTHVEQATPHVLFLCDVLCLGT